MVIGIWILAVVFIVVILGEWKYRCLTQKAKTKTTGALSKKWEDNIEADMDRVSIEHSDSGFVSSRGLAMRGSWRIAQNQAMTGGAFSVLRDAEYSKRL